MAAKLERTNRRKSRSCFLIITSISINCFVSFVSLSSRFLPVRLHRKTFKFTSLAIFMPCWVEWKREDTVSSFEQENRKLFDQNLSDKWTYKIINCLLKSYQFMFRFSTRSASSIILTENKLVTSKFDRNSCWDFTKHKNSSNSLLASISYLHTRKMIFKTNRTLISENKLFESVTRSTFITKIVRVLCTVHKLLRFIESTQGRVIRKKNCTFIKSGWIAHLIYAFAKGEHDRWKGHELFLCLSLLHWSTTICKL